MNASERAGKFRLMIPGMGELTFDTDQDRNEAIKNWLEAGGSKPQIPPITPESCGVEESPAKHPTLPHALQPFKETIDSQIELATLRAAHDDVERLYRNTREEITSLQSACAEAQKLTDYWKRHYEQAMQEISALQAKAKPALPEVLTRLHDSLLALAESGAGSETARTLMTVAASCTMQASKLVETDKRE